MGSFNYARPGSVVGVQADVITGGTVYVNGTKVTVGKPNKCELHYPSGKVTRFTESDPEVIASFIEDVKKGRRNYKGFVVNGKRYGKTN